MNGVHFAPDQKVGDYLADEGGGRGPGDAHNRDQKSVKKNIAEGEDWHEDHEAFLGVKGEDGVAEQGGRIDYQNGQN